MLHNQFADFSSLKILDVGCGVGSLSLYLAKQGATVTGVDVSKRAIKIAEQARKYNGLKKLTFKHQQLKDVSGKFDLIICTEVIEHIPDDTAFAKQLFVKLKPGGFLFLTTPLQSAPLHKLGLLKKWDVEVGHLRRYTPQSITELLQKTGFTIEKTELIEGIVRNWLFTIGWGFLLKFIKGPLVSLFHFKDEILGRIFGFSNIQVLAHKSR
jgi:ubiquinone biosynthesis O-methyltransferase